MSLETLRKKLRIEFGEDVNVDDLREGIEALQDYLSKIDRDTDQLEAGVEGDGNFALRIPVANPEKSYVLKLLTCFMWFKEKIDEGDDYADTDENDSVEET